MASRRRSERAAAVYVDIVQVTSLQIEHQTALVAIATEEKRRHAWMTLRSKLACCVAVGLLDLGDNCA